MFVLTALASVIAILYAASSKGRAAGLCAAWGAVFLCPAWMERKFGAFLLTPRLIAVSVAIGLLFVVVDRWRLNKKIIFLDFFVISITLVELTSMYYSGELTVTLLAQSVASWCVPYLFGRLIATSDVAKDNSEVLRIAVIVVCALAAWGVIEAVIGINPVNTLLGRADYGASYRWGLRRAEGPLQHPIHFGNMMLMLFPWTLEAARRGFNAQGPSWWRLAPIIGFLGVFSSLSRGPILGLFMVVCVVVYLRLPRFRLVLVNTAIIGAAFLVLNFSGAVDTLQSSSGEKQEWGAYMVSIDGNEYEYDGTNHRLLQFLVFRGAIEDAGLFGFGTWGIKPKHIAYIEPSLRAKFWSIDNHYILMTLRSGYLGLGLFIALGLTALSYSLRLGLYGDVDGWLASGMCGALLASMILLWSVWFAPDFAFVWLTSVGLVGGWWAKATSVSTISNPSNSVATAN